MSGGSIEWRRVGDGGGAEIFVSDYQAKTPRIPHVFFPAFSARLGGGRSCGGHEVGVGGAAVDDGILAASVSSPLLDCFSRPSEMESIGSGGGERRRWREMACVGGGTCQRLSVSLSLSFFSIHSYFTLQIGVLLLLFPPNDEISS
nr:hypothetical protein Iba_chr06cCG9350 [Ipomoea batatas]GME02065.1 hypothetical protein Iba_contig3636CG0010 [Ipomoea batatas]